MVPMVVVLALMSEMEAILKQMTKKAAAKMEMATHIKVFKARAL